jgi:uncharacterized protein YcbK (DUF882 family)
MTRDAEKPNTMAGTSTRFGTMVRRARALTFALAGLGLASVLSYSALSQAPASAEAATQNGQRARALRPSQAKSKPRVPVNSAFTALPALDVSFVNTKRSELIRLYDAFGQVDEAAARRLDAMLGDTHDPKHYETALLDRRTLQLLFRAAYHFSAHRVEVVSAYRKPGRRSQGYHGKGQAIDFRLDGVPPAKLAAYLRTLPRVGVGIYTHPKTQYVHLDSRQRSFHWIDASPPGRSWRERSLGGRTLAARDAIYTRSLDWPEGVLPPQIPFEP